MCIYMHHQRNCLLICQDLNLWTGSYHEKLKCFPKKKATYSSKLFGMPVISIFLSFLFCSCMCIYWLFHRSLAQWNGYHNLVNHGKWLVSSFLQILIGNNNMTIFMSWSSILSSNVAMISNSYVLLCVTKPKIGALFSLFSSPSL